MHYNFLPCELQSPFFMCHQIALWIRWEPPVIHTAINVLRNWPELIEILLKPKKNYQNIQIASGYHKYHCYNSYTIRLLQSFYYILKRMLGDACLVNEVYFCRVLLWVNIFSESANLFRMHLRVVYDISSWFLLCNEAKTNIPWQLRIAYLCENNSS